jgi:hypothetical protein
VRDKVLILGSGFSIKQFHDYPYRDEGWFVVAANKSFMFDMDAWDLAVMTHSCQNVTRFGDEWKRKMKPHQRMTTGYDSAKTVGRFGKAQSRGMTIILCTAYYILAEYEPKVIGFLGCDMNYNLDENGKPKGNTTFYGVGDDFRERGISDPDYMAKHWSRWGTLEDQYNKFNDNAVKQNCKLVNFSSDPKTRLPFPQVKPEDI